MRNKLLTMMMVLCCATTAGAQTEETRKIFIYSPGAGEGLHIAVEEGLIPAAGNILVHVDHHDDLEAGPYDHDFTQPMPDAAWMNCVHQCVA